MADDDVAKGAADAAKAAKPAAQPKQKVPPEQWTVEQPFDSAEYLDGSPPSYAGDGDSSDDTTDTTVAP